MNVEIQKLDPLRTVAVRHIGPYNRISEAFGRLGEIVGPANLFKARPMMLAIYHDDQETTPERDLRSDAALVVGEDVKIPAGAHGATHPRWPLRPHHLRRALRATRRRLGALHGPMAPEERRTPRRRRRLRGVPKHSGRSAEGAAQDRPLHPARVTRCDARPSYQFRN